MSKIGSLKQEIARIKAVNAQQQAVNAQQQADIAEVERILNEILALNTSPVNIIKQATGSKKNSVFRILAGLDMAIETDVKGDSRTQLIGEINNYLDVHGKKLTLIDNTVNGVVEFYHFMERQVA